MTDKLIFIVSVLLILSGITEKFTQFVRNYPTQVKIFSYVILGLLLIAIGNTFRVDSDGIGRTMLFAIVMILVSAGFLIGKVPLTKQQPKMLLANITKDSPNRNAQESEVNILSALIGLVVAFMFNANMVTMFKIQEFEQLGWSNEWSDDFPFSLSEFRFLPNKAVFSPEAFMGFLVTGFFLTFGSKFFHDLLDLLMEAKNARRIDNLTTSDGEINLLRLQIDQKATILQRAISGNQKDMLTQEIDELNLKLAKLIKAQHG